MLDELMNVIGTPEFEEFGWVRLGGVEWQGEDAVLSLVLSQQDEHEQQWQIRCQSVREQRIDHSPVYNNVWLELEDDHVLLWPHVLPQVELYFRGKSAKRVEVLGTLWEKHLELVQGWFPFDRFLKGGPPAMKHLDGGFGLFADGPEPLIRAYAEVLDDYAISASTLPPRAPRVPMRWDGQRWIEFAGPWAGGEDRMHVLLFGQTYFVARSFEEKRIV